MTDDELRILADRLADEYTRLLDHTRAVTTLLGLLPMLYGVLTWIFSDALWGSSPVYRTALMVPFAPESWGTVFVTLGLLTIVLAHTNRHRGLTVVSLLTALVLGMFMVAFAWEGYASQTLSALPPAVVYGIFALLFMNRARLAWTSWRADRGCALRGVGS
ncbi:hypothetical protein [Mycolicibacterium goodii]|uniref:Transmembrane protein n=1 Tax=Mycolicibacterium goodii TaxID=134601 RepID=A0ABS6HS16_MYCGD|nr:hypothetical protein [Mycolicibacterium goodii]YP_009013564.1 hypothetical protein DORI_14 [Mycobacterium phage Dori]UVT31547.1 membrane protein [Mycobacterium phage Mask]AER47665.1 hypothetical protein DORI_14 [Mycobacterium phage Dori]MBU8824123.1 hypothetical protein [Mycolicibacterium goodii]MBU8838094.1 hypothetical protein [Mycolicibacterium goodii]